MDIGFIGLGTMGASMAANLQRAGHHLVVHDINRAAAAPHLAAGAAWAESPRALAGAVELVFASLPGPPEVEAVATGPEGLIGALRAGSAFFDLSTNSPTLVRRLHGVFAARGLHLLDAPVSGGPRGAKTRRLAIWVGGERAVFDAHKSVLDAIGDQARHVGAIGAGSVAKLVHNCAGYAIQCALAEVFTLGVKAGLDPASLFEAVRQGAVGRRRTFEGLADQFLPRDYDPAAFALRLAHKDVGLATLLGRELSVPMRMANLALEELTEAMNRGWAARDSRVAMLLQEERAGVTIKADRARLDAIIAGDGPAKT